MRTKDTYYFPHDYEPTSDPKIQALIGEFGASGYGIFWRVVEMLHSDQNHKLPFKQYVFLAIAKQMLANAEQIKAIIDYCIDPCELLYKDADFFWSNRVLHNIQERAKLSEIRSIAGKAGAFAKQKQAKASKGKEKKGKEIKNNIYDDFLIFWDSYHNATGLTKTDKEATIKYWDKLTDSEKQKAVANILPYFNSLRDKKYCKKARTYLSDKNFNDEFGVANGNSCVPKEAYDHEGWGTKIHEDAIN